MQQHDIREELERYITYLETIKEQDMPTAQMATPEKNAFANGTNTERRKQLESVAKSLRAILAKTERIHY